MPWDWGRVIACEKLTIEMILAKPNHPWNWADIYCSNSIPLKTMLKYSQFPWYYKKNQHDDAIAFEKILHNKKLPISLSYSKFLSLDFIAKMPNYKWRLLPYCVNGSSCVLYLEYDRLMFIERQTMLTLLTTLFDFYQQPDVRNSPIPFSNIERIFFDEYLMQLIAKN